MREAMPVHLPLRDARPGASSYLVPVRLHNYGALCGSLALSSAPNMPQFPSLPAGSAL
jgi:hypothetical protein